MPATMELLIVPLLFVFSLSRMLQQTWAEGHPEPYSILEELQLGTIVANMIEDQGLDLKYNQSVIDQLRFSFLTTPQELSHRLLDVDETSGVIQTVDRIDRDRLCPKDEKCLLMYDIAVRPAKYFQIIKVKFEILDINDNAPRFPQEHIVHRISESTLPGKSFSIPGAVDPDSSINSVQRYELVSEAADKFELRVRETADGAVDLRLYLREELDRETNDNYLVQIVAIDGGAPPKSGSVSIEIHVLDANDNDPKFENASYEVHVLEDVPAGRTILKVNAIDPDLSDNGIVEYFFSRHTQHNYGDIFGIDRETGEIFIRGELDYEEADIFLLSVTAQDKGPDSLPAQTNVVVKIIDVNDNAPKITVNTLTTTGDAHVTENAPPEAFVAHIKVEDGDSGSNGLLACTLDDPNFKLQKLYNSEYKIVTQSQFDRELQPYFDLRIHCYDGGSNPLSSFAHIRVNVVDENDYAPRFTQQSYEIDLTENNKVDDFILAVTATDRDEGKNGWVQFKLGDDARNLVAIDEDTGWITANVVFDHERYTDLRFHVIATDKGTDTKSATASVHIKILDIDDEKPEFLQDHYTFGALENEPSGTSIGKLVAVDTDSEPHNYFTYGLDPLQSPMDVFEVDPFSGDIRTKQMLDREDQPVYYMVVLAKGSGEGKTSTASVSVYVADRNDNNPVFDFPSPTNHTVHISNQAPTGHVIARVRAHDADTGDNARLSYLVFEGNEEDYFTLDPSTGIVIINRDLTHLKKKDFRLHVRVEDHGKPPLTAHSHFEIVVNNALDYRRSSSGITISRDNLIILIIFTTATVIISVIIIITIIIIRRRDHQHRQEEEVYEKEMEKMLPREESANHTKHKPDANKKPHDKKTVGFAQNCIDKSDTNCADHYRNNVDAAPKVAKKVTVPAVPIRQNKQVAGTGQQQQGASHEDSDSALSGLSNSDSGRGPSSEEEDLNHKLSMESLPASEMLPKHLILNGGGKRRSHDISGNTYTRRPPGCVNQSATLGRTPKAGIAPSPSKKSLSNQAMCDPRDPHATNTLPHPHKLNSQSSFSIGASCKPMSQSSFSIGNPASKHSQSSHTHGTQPLPSIDSQSPTYSQIHPHNLIRDTETPEGPVPDNIAYINPRTVIPNKGVSSLTNPRPHKQYMPLASKAKDDVLSYSLYQPGSAGEEEDHASSGATSPPPSSTVVEPVEKDFVVFNYELGQADRTTDV